MSEELFAKIVLELQSSGISLSFESGAWVAKRDGHEVGPYTMANDIQLAFSRIVVGKWVDLIVERSNKSDGKTHR